MNLEASTQSEVKTSPWGTVEELRSIWNNEELQYGQKAEEIVWKLCENSLEDVLVLEDPKLKIFDKSSSELTMVRIPEEMDISLGADFLLYIPKLGYFPIDVTVNEEKFRNRNSSQNEGKIIWLIENEALNQYVWGVDERTRKKGLQSIIDSLVSEVSDLSKNPQKIQRIQQKVLELKRNRNIIKTKH